MAKQAITFPKVKDTNVWRNARTGTLIQRERATGRYAIYAPSTTHGGSRFVEALPTLAEARKAAVDVVTATLVRRDIDHAEALHEAAAREAFDTSASVVEHVGQLVRFRHDFSDALIGVEFVIDELSFAADAGYRVARIRHHRKGRGWTYRLARLDDLRTVSEGCPLKAADVA